MVTRNILFLLLVMVAPLSHALSALTAQVDRNPVMAGETVLLTITADDNLNGGNLDTSALLADFIVGRTNISRSTQVINGKVKRISRWSIALIAQKTGQYTIPTFTIDGISTDPITLSVIKATSTTLPNADILLKTSLSKTKLYIGQQLVYTVKLFIGASLQRAQLQEPQLANAEIIQLGEDADSNEILNGRRYRVITRQYSIRPTHAGAVELQGSVFRGDIQVAQRDFFSGGRSKPITILSDNHPLDIMPIPDDFPGNWLVSDMVILEQSWPESMVFKVGEPITRTLTLTATNVTKEQLPAITMPLAVSIQAYPDKTTAQQSLSGDIIVAQTVQKVALIPSQAGDIVLPEIKVPWLNATTNNVEWATIAAQTITVMPADTRGVQTVAPPIASTNTAAPVTSIPSNNTVVVQSTKLIYWQLATVLLLLSSLTLLVLLIHSRKRSSVDIKATQKIQASDQHWLPLKTAIKNSDHRQVIRLLPLWLSCEYKLSLEQLSLASPQLYNIYQNIIANQYADSSLRTNNQAPSDDFKLLLTALNALKHQRQTINIDDSLYPLNN